MESEIQFLLGLVLNHKLPAECKKACLERIGIVEQSLRSVQPQRPAPVINVGQAPSTQRILEQNPDLAPAVSPVPVNIPPAARDKETGLVNVVTSTTSGGSTRGPSKVFR